VERKRRLVAQSLQQNNEDGRGEEVCHSVGGEVLRRAEKKGKANSFLVRTGVVT